ncbi:dATP/dGTP pyrophosphohydrolase domain-containing protein [Escherichia coli]|uniref:dATP/dGTP pyrophosphohydrolase domain-containing protein n=1 Tax=Escherichia coli TaxID=562 RepID=UPI00245366C9|nr:dATP/dGTP pyrophosphohydrolase domain-containing protein [Escherichia coli]
MRHEHAKWSDSTFGCVGPIGPLKHLSKEALEAAAEPDDLSEWADMQFLLWDAQRRAGISDAEITAAMEDKLKINMERQWPEPKDGEPRLHIKEPGNSPVIPDGLSTVCAEAYQVVGVMADALGVFGDAAVQKVLDNLSQQKLVHRDVLPFSLPVTQDGWISCSERMPVIGELNWRTSFPLLVTCEIGVIPAYYGFVSVNGDRHYGFMESLKYGDDNGNHPQTNEYGLISNVTHWMPLPERRRSRTANNAELFQKISALATECHAIASELDVGDERTEMFEIYSVLRNLCRRGYATQVGRMTNPLLSFCDEDDSDEDDE